MPTQAGLPTQLAADLSDLYERANAEFRAILGDKSLTPEQEFVANIGVSQKYFILRARAEGRTDTEIVEGLVNSQNACEAMLTTCAPKTP